MRPLFIALLGMALNLHPAAAQTLSRPLAFNALTINDGLSQGMVVRILQDRYGFMWFATLDGLNRYDGYGFTVYRHDPHDASSITKSYATSLFEDSKGRLWIGTVSGGLDLYDRETETFRHIRSEAGDGQALSEGAVHSMGEDRSGNIWVQVGTGMAKLTPKGAGSRIFSIHTVPLPQRSRASLLAVTSSGHVFFADSWQGVLYKLADTAGMGWEVALRLAEDTLLKRGQVSLPYRIVQLMEDKKKKRLYAIHEGGITGIDEGSGAMVAGWRNNLFGDKYEPLHATLDPSGTLWYIGGKGLCLFDTRTGAWQQATAFDPQFSGRLAAAYSVFIDRSGLLWIGLGGYGLLKRSLRSEAFHHTGTASNYSIIEAEDGRLLMGNGLVVREVFDRKTGVMTETKSMAPQEVQKLNRYLFRPLLSDGSGDWYVESSGLRYEDKGSHKSGFFPLPVEPSDDYADLIHARLTDAGGNIWLGTTEGLLHFNTKKKRWTLYTNKPGNPASLSSTAVFSLCLDPRQPQRYLWAGTNGGGLNRLDMQTGTFTAYSTKDGLPNGVVYSILKDDAGHLWMSTNKGLSCFDPLKKTFRNFDHRDGLQSNEFNRGAYARTRDGWLFFGGVNGFNYFHPREILRNTTAPQVVLTGLRLRNQPVVAGSKGSPLSKAIYLTDKLTLPYDQNFIAFEFASMDFTDPGKNTYQYRLEGLDPEWIQAGTTNGATYTNLDPGTYTFRVQGSNNDGSWSAKGASIQLTILPPWWGTWWFRIAVMLLLLLAAWAFDRYRLAQAVKLESMRNRIARDLHDEVGSNLSNIYIFSNVAQQRDPAAATAPLLQKITDYTKQSMEAMNDIVWMINTRNDRFENVVVRMRTLAAEFSETCGCALHLDFDEALNGVKLNMEDRKNFYLIYKEAVNNVAKYAAPKDLWVDMHLRGSNVSLEIRDNGKGFDVANATHGNGLKNMATRAQLLKGNLTVKSNSGEGTTVMLQFKA